MFFKYNDSALLFQILGKILLKLRHTLIQDWIKFIPHPRSTSSDSLPETTCSRKTYRTNPIAHKVNHKVIAAHFAKSERKEKSVTYLAVHVEVIHNMETVTQEYFLHLCRTLCINPRIRHKVNDPVAGKI